MATCRRAEPFQTPRADFPLRASGRHHSSLSPLVRWGAGHPPQPPPRQRGQERGSRAGRLPHPVLSQPLGLFSAALTQHDARLSVLVCKLLDAPPFSKFLALGRASPQCDPTGTGERPSPALIGRDQRDRRGRRAFRDGQNKHGPSSQNTRASGETGSVTGIKVSLSAPRARVGTDMVTGQCPGCFLFLTSPWMGESWSRSRKHEGR